ncbi:AfsR/SARP family transcriptional regulator [Fodinicola feengrottensis]|uniref:AfsR/SARP family transcriptional regulator n=1 Tax=Fodinicola feengrottensis TaxID=435914 RepID=UPI0013D23892|nr:AfsR/SARP family transcriptional regulator [Fodinicola feengrottensis]
MSISDPSAAGAGVRVGLLGPLEVSVDGVDLELPSGRLGPLLAALALSAGQPVPVDRLAGWLWGPDVPAHTGGSLASLVSRLRTALRSEAIRAASNGYLLEVRPDQVDVWLFRRLVQEAEQLTDLQVRRDRLSAALRLWRGQPLTGLRPEHLANDVGLGLLEERLDALERRVDIDLALGEHQGLIVELREATSQYPLRESLWLRLMTVLSRSGRAAEALDCYASVRTRLRDELGADPGEQLQQQYQRLLASAPEPVPAAAPAVIPAILARWPVARQLPAPPRLFSGRGAELARLTEALDSDRDGTAILAIEGIGGIGKTWLALRWAYERLERFPDGQLFVNLRGFDPAVPPLDASTALRSFLMALGVSSTAIPADEAAQADCSAVCWPTSGC